MDRNINDNDRIVIGVREWAIEKVYEKGDDVEIRLKTASKLEEFVLRDIGGTTSFQPDKAHPPKWENRS